MRSSFSRPFSIPMEISYNGQKRTVIMGTFQHSMEREFALAANKRAIAECRDMEGLKQAATNLLEGWSAMQTASQSMMLENIQLRQALDQKQNDLLAAEQRKERRSENGRAKEAAHGPRIVPPQPCSAQPFGTIPRVGRQLCARTALRAAVACAIAAAMPG